MEYQIKDDLKLIREYYRISQTELASLIGENRLTIARTEAGISYPRDSFMDKFYGKIYENGLRINLQKEMYYKEKMNSGMVLLTHGAKTEITGSIDIGKGKPHSDFGQGFYCEESYDNAASFVSRFPKSCIYFISLDTAGLKNHIFSVDNEWMLAIAYFRGMIPPELRGEKIKKILKKLDGVDYIIAPIADNRMFAIITEFIEGLITDEQCKHCLAATNLGMQYVFLTDKSISHLSILERVFIPSIEKNDIIKRQEEANRIGSDKVKLARIQYKNEGQYIGGILK